MSNNFEALFSANEAGHDWPATVVNDDHFDLKVTTSIMIHSEPEIRTSTNNQRLTRVDLAPCVLCIQDTSNGELQQMRLAFEEIFADFNSFQSLEDNFNSPDDAPEPSVVGTVIHFTSSSEAGDDTGGTKPHSPEQHETSSQSEQAKDLEEAGSVDRGRLTKTRPAPEGTDGMTSGGNA